MKKVLCVFAHPDDEAFGPGGTIAKWAREGTVIHLLCATKGENEVMKASKPKIGDTRSKELRSAAKILGIKKISFLGFSDGRICNNDLLKLEKIITKKIKSFNPHRILTFDLNGVSGHIDHIAVSSATTQAFKKTKIAKELYYYTLLKVHAQGMDDYFIHFPEGKEIHETDIILDVKDVWKIKVKAMYEHKSQLHDVKRILSKWEKLEKKEHFLVRRITS